MPIYLEYEYIFFLHFELMSDPESNPDPVPDGKKMLDPHPWYPVPTLEKHPDPQPWIQYNIYIFNLDNLVIVVMQIS